MPLLRTKEELRIRSRRPLPTSLGTRSAEILGKSGVASSPHGQQANCTTLPHAAVARAWPHRACTSCYGLANACLREGGRGEEEEAHGE